MKKSILSVIIMMFIVATSSMSLANTDYHFENVSVDKVWSIVFNQDVDSSSINNISLKSETGESKAISVKLSSDSKTILVSPSADYDFNKKYILSINDQIKSTSGKHLASGSIVKFTTVDENIEPTDCVNPDLLVYNLPEELGMPKLTKAQVQELVGAEPEEIQEKISTVYDLLQYLKLVNFDLRETTGAQDGWIYSNSGKQVVKENRGNLTTVVKYVLKDDYEEIGFVQMLYDTEFSYAMNYIKQDGIYYFISIENYEYNGDANICILKTADVSSIVEKMRGSIILNGEILEIEIVAKYENEYVLPVAYGLEGKTKYFPEGSSIDALYENPSYGFSVEYKELPQKIIDEIQGIEETDSNIDEDVPYTIEILSGLTTYQRLVKIKLNRDNDVDYTVSVLGKELEYKVNLDKFIAIIESSNEEKIKKGVAIAIKDNSTVLGDLGIYNTLLKSKIESDYTSASWAAYQEVVRANIVNILSTQAEVDIAVVNISAAQSDLILNSEDVNMNDYIIGYRLKEISFGESYYTLEIKTTMDIYSVKYGDNRCFGMSVDDESYDAQAFYSDTNSAYAPGQSITLDLYKENQVYVGSVELELKLKRD